MKRVISIAAITAAAIAAWFLLWRLPLIDAREKGAAESVTSDGYKVIISVDAAYRKPLLARFHYKENKLKKTAGGVSEETAGAAAALVARVRLEELLASDGKAPRSIGASLSSYLKSRGCELKGKPSISVRLAPGQFSRYVSSRARKTGQKFIILGMDGLDWLVIDSLMAKGLLPNFRKMIAEGTTGNLRSIEPILSPLVWTTMATGKLPEQHGITDFITQSADGKIIPMNSTYRTVPALWQMLSWGGVKPAFLCWLQTWPAENFDGYMLTDRIVMKTLRGEDSADSELTGDTSWPPGLIDEYSPALKQTGDKDGGRAAAATLNADFPGAGEFINKYDERTGRVTVLKDAVGVLLSSRAAGLKMLREKKPDVEAIYFSLPDTIGHEFMEFAPEKRPWTGENEYKAFKDVVGRAYQLMDETLGMYIAAAGDEYNIVIVSDHGFKSGDQRPRETGAIDGKITAMWHRIMGVIMARGPAIARGRTIDRASVKDIAPTLLYATGLPAGADMAGSPLKRLFTDEFNSKAGGVANITSYDWGWQPRNDAVLASARKPNSADKEILNNLKQLGYITDTGEKAPGGNPGAGRQGEKGGKEGGQQTRKGTDYRKYTNLGTRAMEEKRYSEAVDNFKKALSAEPDSPMLMLGLADAQLKNGDREEAIKIMRAAAPLGADMPAFHSNYGAILMGMGLYPEAERELLASLKLDRGFAETYNNLGLIAYKTRRLKEAAGRYRQALKLEPDSAMTRLNLGIACWDMQDFKCSAAELEKTFSLNRDYEKRAMLVLAAGISHYETGNARKASQRLGQAKGLNPRIRQAHYYLGLIAEKRGDAPAARENFKAELDVSPADPRALNSLNKLR